MRCKLVEIRWHEKTPIYSADFHSAPPTEHQKAHHPYAATGATGAAMSESERKEMESKERERTERDKKWRLATCGADNVIRLWLVHPRPAPPTVPTSVPVASSSSSSTQQPGKDASSSRSNEQDPKVEFLATLSQHTGVVNCVRFAPQGDMLASAGDDGNILIWVPGESNKKFGNDVDEDRVYEKESWRVKSMIRSMSGKEIYDLAWSPDSEKILAGSVDHSATIYDVASGTMLYKATDHANYVQGVAWDPLEQYIATQSSDRSMHVYQYSTGPSGLVVHQVGKNARMDVQRRPPSSTSRSPSCSRSLKKTDSTPGDLKAPSPVPPVASTSKAGGGGLEPARPPMHQRSLSRASDSDRSEASSTAPSSIFSVPPSAGPKPDEVTTSMDPPASIPHHPRPVSHSRRSSTSGSAPSQSPGLHPFTSRPLRSPSPAPLPAVMVPLSPKLNPVASTSSGGASSSASFNNPVRTDNIKLYGDASTTLFFRRLAWSPDGGLLLTPAGLFEDPYAEAHAQATAAASASTSSASAVVTKKSAKGKKDDSAASKPTDPKPTVYIYSRSNVARPPIAHLPGHKATSIAIRFCPVLWDLREAAEGKEEGEATEAEQEEAVSVTLTAEGVDVPLAGSVSAAKGKGKAVEREGSAEGAMVEGEKTEGEGEKKKPKSLFDLPYRMVYAVATLDSVYLYDTQQAGPIAMFAGLHWKPFTDLTWSADGQTLVIPSEDGYCSIVAFEPGELGTPYHTQPKSRTSQPQQHHLHDPHAHHHHPAHSHSHSHSHSHAAPSSFSTTATSPINTADASTPSAAGAAVVPGALPALFAAASTSKDASTPASPASIIIVDDNSQPQASTSSSKREGEGEGAGDVPPAKKVKKRVQPTLVRELGE